MILGRHRSVCTIVSAFMPHLPAGLLRSSLHNNELRFVQFANFADLRHERQLTWLVSLPSKVTAKLSNRVPNMLFNISNSYEMHNYASCKLQRIHLLLLWVCLWDTSQQCVLHSNPFLCFLFYLLVRFSLIYMTQHSYSYFSSPSSLSIPSVIWPWRRVPMTTCSTFIYNIFLLVEASLLS